MPIRCPKCPSQQLDESELYRHLQSVHRLTDNEIRRLGVGGSGWREQAQNTPNGRVAIEHQEAALRAQMEKNRPMDIPMVVANFASKKEMEIPAGWKKMNDRYTYEKVISEAHTVDSIEKQILKATVTVNHMEADLFSYSKDVRKLKQMEEKASILESRLAGYTVDDPEFIQICNNLHPLKFEITQHAKSLQPVMESELVLEKYYRGEKGSEEHTQWQIEMMKVVIAEADRLISISRRETTKVI